MLDLINDSVTIIIYLILDPLKSVAYLGRGQIQVHIRNADLKPYPRHSVAPDAVRSF